MFSLELAAFIAAATCAAILTRQLLFIRKYPTAPGPSLAVTSRLWYLCKVWQGHFETWNIEQHALHGKILRVAPNWYSIDDVNAMKPIYGLQTKMVKSDWYLRWGEPGSPGRDFFSAVDPVYHSQLRRRFAQMYSMTTMRSYEPFVSDCTAIVLEKLDVQASSGEIFNLQFWMQCYAFDNAGAITYSVPAGFVGSDEEEVHSIIDKIDAAFSFSVHYNIYNFLLPFLLVRFGRFDKFIDLWTKRLDRIRKNTKINNEERNAEDFSTKLDALRAKDPAAAQHYRDHTLLIANMTAGSDTTGITLTAIFFYLTKYPNTLEKLRFVIKEARAQGKMSTPVTFEESQKLPYLQYVIKESMRLFPGTGLPMWRVVQKPGETIAGTFFPPGVSTRTPSSVVCLEKETIVTYLRRLSSV